MKTCCRCSTSKPVEQFFRNKRNRDGRDGHCKLCDAVRKPSRAARDRIKWSESMRRVNYRRMYGITIDDYEQMLKAQNGQCAICGTSNPGGGYKNFAVDHDHTSGEVRGLLCTRCNRGLGLFKDDAVLTQLATNYLRSHKALTTSL